MVPFSRPIPDLEGKEVAAMRPNWLPGALLGAIVFASLVYTARSQEAAPPAISTERPTVGFSPDLIPKGSLQSENGAGGSSSVASTCLMAPRVSCASGSRITSRFVFSPATRSINRQPAQRQDICKLPIQPSAPSCSSPDRIRSLRSRRSSRSAFPPEVQLQAQAPTIPPWPQFGPRPCIGATS
jgi:hypothetical protein